MKRVRVILKGEGKAEARVRPAIERLRDAGQPLEVRTTGAPGDAARQAAQAADEGVEVLVAAGGDGTLNEVVNGVLGADDSSEMAVGLLPLGTANDFARGCGLPFDLDDALELAVDGDPAAIDVVRVNDLFFVNVASGGFGAEVTEETPEDLKAVVGGSAYALAGVVTGAARLQPYEGRLELAEESIEGPFLVMAVANAGRAGGGFEVAPRARLDDGLLDLLFIREFGASDLATVIVEARQLGSPSNRFVHYRQVSSCEVILEKEIPVNLDGEPHRWDRMSFEIVPKRLRMVLPDGCPLIGFARSADGDD